MEGQYIGIYIGREMCGIKQSHQYDLDISNNGRTYEVNITYDHTDEKNVELYMMYSNENSINRYWNIER